MTSKELFDKIDEGKAPKAATKLIMCKSAGELYEAAKTAGVTDSQDVFFSELGRMCSTAAVDTGNPGKVFGGSFWDEIFSKSKITIAV